MQGFMLSQFLLEVDPNMPILNKGELISYGSKMMLVGMGIVFSVLIVLYACLSLFKYLCGILQNSKDENDKASSVKDSQIITREEVSEEIIAVIAAAIAMANEEFPDKKFRVVSFKRL